MKNQNGFILPFVLAVGVAVSGVVSVTYYNNQKVSKVIASNRYRQEVAYIVSNVKRWASKTSVCSDMFSSVDFASGDTQPLTQLTSAESSLLVQVGQTYGPRNNIELTSMHIEKLAGSEISGMLRLFFNVNIPSGTIYGGTSFMREIPISFELGGTTQITTCFSNKDRLAEALIRFCNGPGVHNGLGAGPNPTSLSCSLRSLASNLDCGAGSGEIPMGLNYDSVSGEYSTDCQPPVQQPIDVAACSGDTIPVGIDASGAVICQNLDKNYISGLIDETKSECSSGQIKIDTTGTRAVVDCVAAPPPTTTTTLPSCTPGWKAGAVLSTGGLSSGKQTFTMPPGRHRIKISRTLYCSGSGAVAYGTVKNCVSDVTFSSPTSVELDYTAFSAGSNPQRYCCGESCSNTVSFFRPSTSCSPGGPHVLGNPYNDFKYYYETYDPCP